MPGSRNAGAVPALKEREASTPRRSIGLALLTPLFPSLGSRGELGTNIAS